MNVLPDSFINAIAASNPPLVVFAVMRNEAVRLDAWLRHYREMGVRKFAVVDNGSLDATPDILAAQEDVVFTTIEGGYAQSNFGVEWAHEFHDRIPPGTWVLFVDGDEFLVYRGWPKLPLSSFLDQARQRRCNAIYAFLLDMYPPGPLEAAQPVAGSDLFGIAPCFDSDYVFRDRPRKPWEPSQRALEIVGGPRVRMLSSFEKEVRSTWIDYWLSGQVDRILPLVPDRMVPFVVRRMPRQMPCLSKVPIVMAGEGFRYANAHGGSGGRLFGENTVLCHFKFLADFAARAREEAVRKEHFRRGAEYILYADAISHLGHLDLTYERSHHFEGAEQLVELGLIRDIGSVVGSGETPEDSETIHRSAVAESRLSAPSGSA